MNILYIWEGRKPLPADRAENIKVALERYPDAHFKCITRLDSFFSSDFEVISWEQTKSDITGYYFLDDAGGRLISYMTFSDWARFHHLMKNPDTLYMDTDVKLLEPYPFHEQERLVKPKHEICLIYAPKNGVAVEIAPTLKERLRRQPSYILLWDIDKNLPPGSFTEISRDHFHHWR
jgi:hypothetical protein